MSNDQSRRESSAATIQDPIPNAPPLPAPKPLQRARDAAYRVFGYPSRPPSAHDDFAGEYLTRGPASRYASLSATQNATATHKTGLEINTIAINEKGTHALLGGKEIFKTLRVEEGSCAEELNLRTSIRSRPTEASGKPRQIYSIDIADVAWAKGDCGDFVAAATSSGKIILYDLGHAGLQAAQLHEHYRQVHKVTFNPHRGNLLLSGSQDGTVRLWDVRDARNQASTLQSKRKYSGQSDGVRDVKWSPTDGVDFAFGTDSGWIQCWDMRHLRTAKVKIPAHALSCNIIDWHPDGKHVASGSSDKTVRVWNLSTSGRQKASWEIKTPYPVLNARWRPSYEASSRLDSGARQCTQLVTAYDREHPVIHIWDFRRPALPFREMSPYQSAPTDLLWHSQDLLWTVGREGIFLQADIQHAPKVINKRALQSIATSAEGDITFVSQKRMQRRTPRLRHSSSQTTNSTNNISASPDTSFLSRSWADDTLDHSFLSVQPPRRSNKSDLTKIPISTSATGSLIVPFNISTNDQYSFVPRQVGVMGHMPYQVDPDVFRHLARKYVATVTLTPTVDDDFLQHVQSAFNTNYQVAYGAGQYLLAQTWKILGVSTLNHLKARVAHQKEQREEPTSRAAKRSTEPSLGRLVLRLLAEHNKSPMPSPTSLRPISNLVAQLALPESTSNVPTPLARPTTNTILSTTRGEGNLPDPDNDERLTLPPSLQSPIAQHQVQDRKLTSHNLKDLEQQQHEVGTDRIDMVRRWSVQTNEQPLGPVPASTNGIKAPPKLQKHDSDESFMFLAGSTDSKGPSLPGSLTSDGPMGLVAEHPSRRPAPMARERHADPVKQHVDVSDTLLREDVIVNSPSAPQAASLPPTKPVTVSNGGAVSPNGNPAGESLYSLPDADIVQVDLEENNPFSLVEMVCELVKFQAGDADAQTAAHLLTLISPLLPRTHELEENVRRTTALIYADAYSSSSFSSEEIVDIIDKHLEHIMMAGIQPLQIESVLWTYHEQLLAYRMFNEAAYLRKLAYPAYPAVYEDFSKDNEVHLKCGECGKPMMSGMSTLKCENCHEKACCPICWLKDSPHGGNKLMTTCLLCNHSGHAECVRQWFGDSDGDGCPTGCGCNCVGKLGEKKGK